MQRFFLLVIVLLTALVPVQAIASDANASKRGVVRIVSAFELPDGRIIGGHGTGFAIAPNRVVTNFHVIEDVIQFRGDRALFLVPSEGDRFFVASIVAVDRARDLALIEVEGANLPVLTLFTGSIESGENITAIGYPGNVDRATLGRANSLQAVGRYLRPMVPELTEGNFSSQREVGSYTALVHSANIAQGNSGGPLVDECGRVIGVNSAQTINGNGDSPFAFAIAGPELVRFLQREDQSFQRIADECISADEFAELERARAAEELRIANEAAAEEAAATAAEAARIDDLERAIEREISEERETMMFLATLLLLGGGLAVGGAFVMSAKGEDKKKAAITVGALGGLLICGAVGVFLSRPSLSDQEIQSRLPQSDNAEGTDQGALPADEEMALVGTDDDRNDRDYMTANSGVALRGDEAGLVCVIDRSRSRITTTAPSDIDLQWQEGGCVNGSKQYAPQDAGRAWSRVLVPNQDATVSHWQFNPEQSRLTVDKYALSLQQMTQARDLRSRITMESCTADTSAVAQLGDRQEEILEDLPDLPNERLVYDCQPS